MYIALIFFRELDLHSHLFGDANGLGDFRIVDIQSDRAAGEREVGTVTAIRRGERRMKKEVNFDWIFVEDLARDAPEARGAGGVRAGRTDHDRSHDVEDGDFADRKSTRLNSSHR